MKLINLKETVQNKEFFGFLLDIEEALEKKIEFLVLNSKGEVVEEDEGYVKEFLNSKGETDKDFVVIYLFGRHHNISYNGIHRFSPAISLSPFYLKYFHRGNMTQITRGDGEGNNPYVYLEVSPRYFQREPNIILPEGVDFIMGESESPFGLSCLEEGKFPSIYVHYDFGALFVGDDENHKLAHSSAFKYIIEKGLHNMSFLADKPEIISPPLEEEESLQVFIEGVHARAFENQRYLTEQVDNIHRQYVDHLRLQAEGEKLIESLSDISKISNSLKELDSNEDILWYKVRTPYLMVMTRFITIEDYDSENEKREYIIGNILIKIDFKTCEVYFDNVSRKVRGLNDRWQSHPHDMSGEHRHEYGHICLGEIKYFIPKLINKMEIGALMTLLINFAKSVNKDDSAGKTIIKWPFK